jgi:putative oxidoreductase
MSLGLTAGGEVAFLLARVVVGGVLAFMGLNHFLDADAMSGYAEAKGLPAPKLAVLGSGGTLLFGGLSVALGVFPAIGAGALALFLLVATPTMHDFWSFDDPEQVQAEMTNFLKNVALLGAALGFLALSAVEWPYAVGLGL